MVSLCTVFSPFPGYFILLLSIPVFYSNRLVSYFVHGIHVCYGVTACLVDALNKCRHLGTLKLEPECRCAIFQLGLLNRRILNPPSSSFQSRTKTSISRSMKN